MNGARETRVFVVNSQIPRRLPDVQHLAVLHERRQRKANARPVTVLLRDGLFRRNVGVAPVNSRGHD